MASVCFRVLPVRPWLGYGALVSHSCRSSQEHSDLAKKEDLDLSPTTPEHYRRLKSSSQLPQLGLRTQYISISAPFVTYFANSFQHQNGYSRDCIDARYLAYRYGLQAQSGPVHYLHLRPARRCIIETGDMASRHGLRSVHASCCAMQSLLLPEELGDGRNSV